MGHCNHQYRLRGGLLAVIFLGAVLCLVANGAATHAQSVCITPYIVQPGDGWLRIAKHCGVSDQALREANQELWQERGDRLQIGDRLQLPSVATPLPPLTSLATPWPTSITPLPATTPPGTIVSPSQTSLETVRRFWRAVISGIRSGDFRTAYGYLTPRQQSILSYTAFQAEFATLHEVTITSIATVQESATQATVDAVIVAADGSGAAWQYQHFRYRYSLVPSYGQWRIDTIRKFGVEPTPVPSGCAGAPPTRLQRGIRAYVLPQPPLPNRVFREPDRQSPLLGRIPPNEAMSILDGPRCGQSSVWWYVQADNGVIGWTAEGQVGEYWLAPLGATGAPVVSPILFCTQIDSANRCLAPTTSFPVGLKRIEVNWSFQNLPINTSIRHLWYHEGHLFYQRDRVIWPANSQRTAGVGYTFYMPLGGLPTGEWRLEFRRVADGLLLQSATFRVGYPAR